MWLGVFAFAIVDHELAAQTVDFRDDRFAGQGIGNGDLTLRPRELSAPVEVRGSYCAVTLEWPAGLRAPFDGQTTSGNIAWDLPEKPSLRKTNGTSVTRAFSDAAGKPGVTIVTTYGDIRVKEAGPESKVGKMN